MALLDLLDLGELFTSWRLYVGLAVTGVVCWLVFQAMPNETIGWAICVPTGIIGVALSFRWQIRADFDK